MLKVAVIGGLGCGKTTALTSLLSQLRSGSLSEYLVIEDRTSLRDVGISLTVKDLEIRCVLESVSSDKICIPRRHPSAQMEHYKFKFRLPGANLNFDIEFIEIPGSMLNFGTHYYEIRHIIQNVDVIMIAIETPYLMGSIESSSKDLCTEQINIGVNRINEIKDLLTYVEGDGEKTKMIVFTPLKCERWAKESGGLDKVTNRVKEVFSSSIQHLSSIDKLDMLIIPMQTSGNILFAEFREAYIYDSTEGPVECCRISKDIIRTYDGEFHMCLPGEKIYQNPEYVIFGTNLFRPSCWYIIDTANNSYAPHNCDQLVFHILRFVIESFKVGESEKSFMRGNKYKEWLGTVNIKDLENVYFKLQMNGDVKENVDGIEIIKKL